MVNAAPALLLLSGTPASGKDTVTRAILRRSDRFIWLRRYRTGTAAPKPPYHQVDEATFEWMAEFGQFLQHHDRYGRRYGITARDVIAAMVGGLVPILHIGRPGHLAPLLDFGGPGAMSVLLLSGRRETQTRLEGRSPGDPADVRRRLAAYETERAELARLLHTGKPLPYDVAIETGRRAAGETAEMILQACGLPGRTPPAARG